MPSASPLALTEATVVFDELQVTRSVRSRVVPSLKVPEAAYCWVCPISMVEFGGVTVMDVSRGRCASAQPVSAPRIARTATSTSIFEDEASGGRQSKRVNFTFRSISLLVITSVSFLLGCCRLTSTLGRRRALHPLLAAITQLFFEAACNGSLERSHRCGESYNLLVTMAYSFSHLQYYCVG